MQIAQLETILQQGRRMSIVKGGGGRAKTFDCVQLCYGHKP